MDKISNSAAPGFLTIGIVFLIIGFVQQGFTISFESGFFILGLFFVLGALIGYVLRKRNVERDAK